MMTDYVTGTSNVACQAHASVAVFARTGIGRAVAIFLRRARVRNCCLVIVFFTFSLCRHPPLKLLDMDEHAIDLMLTAMRQNGLGLRNPSHDNEA
jgi:hypothetical protein